LAGAIPLAVLGRMLVIESDGTINVVADEAALGSTIARAMACYTASSRRGATVLEEIELHCECIRALGRRPDAHRLDHLVSTAPGKLEAERR